MGLTRKLFNKVLRILLLANGMVLVAGAMLAPIYDSMFLVMSLLAFTSVVYLLRLPRKAV